VKPLLTLFIKGIRCEVFGESHGTRLLS
jgi:hypothetical protein